MMKQMCFFLHGPNTKSLNQTRPFRRVEPRVLLGTAGFYLAAAQFREIYRDLDSMQAESRGD